MHKQRLPSVSGLDAPNLRRVILTHSYPHAKEFSSLQSKIRFDEDWHSRPCKIRFDQAMDYTFMKSITCFHSNTCLEPLYHTSLNRLSILNIALGQGTSKSKISMMRFPWLRILSLTVQDKVFDIPQFNCPQLTVFSFYSRNALGLLRADTVDNLAQSFSRLTELNVGFLYGQSVTTKVKAHLSVERTLKLYSEQLTSVNLKDVDFKMFESGQLLQFPKLTSLHLDRTEQRGHISYSSDINGCNQGNGIAPLKTTFQLHANCPELKTLIVHIHGQEFEYRPVFGTTHLERVYIKAKAGTDRNYSHPRGSLKHEVHSCSWLVEEPIEFQLYADRSLWKDKEIGDATGNSTGVDGKTGRCIIQ